MSSLWTPGGEHPVDRPGPGQPAAAPEPPGEHDLDGVEIDPERAKALRAEMDEIRRRLSEVPAEMVVANHAMGLYELAAIHLSNEPPSLPEAALAIDAMGAIVEGLTGRLGDAEPTLTQALAQIRLAFVQVKAGLGG